MSAGLVQVRAVEGGLWQAVCDLADDQLAVGVGASITEALEDLEEARRALAAADTPARLT